METHWTENSFSKVTLPELSEMDTIKIMVQDNDDDNVKIDNSWGCAFDSGIRPFVSLRGNDETTPGANV